MYADLTKSELTVVKKNLDESSSQLLVNLCVETEQTPHWKFKCWIHFAEIKSYYEEI